MNKDIHNPDTVQNIGTLMSEYQLRAPSVWHLIKFLDDMEALIIENEKTAYENGFNHCLNNQFKNDI